MYFFIWKFEAEKTSNSTQDLLDKLFDPPLLLEEDSVDLKRDAHFDLASTQEMAKWSSSFSFIRVRGIAIKNNNSTTTEEVESLSNFLVNDICNSPSQPFKERCLNSFDLSVKGKSKLISIAIDTDEELFASHGTVEEIIDFDCLDNEISIETENNFLNSPPLSPFACKREETVALIFKSIWPDIVHSLQPLVENVITTCVKTNYKYSEDIDQHEESDKMNNSRPMEEENDWIS
jgi:hypothetical protein